MQRKLVKEEVENILEYEKEKIFNDGLLKNEKEAEEYLKIIKEEMKFNKKLII